MRNLSVLLSVVIFISSFVSIEAKEDAQQVLDQSLIHAVKQGDHGSMRKLLDEGANADATFGFDNGLATDRTPVIFIPISKKDFEAFRILKESGADLKARSVAYTKLIPIPLGDTLYEHLLKTEDVDFVRLVIPEIEISKKQFHDGLLIASQFESPEVFDYLLTVSKDYMRPQDSLVEEALPGMEAYLVQPGDSLWLIARRHNLTTQEIIDANPDLESESLRVEEIIQIPRKQGDLNEDE